jgi:diguanylate cyclase (GGDEF)-like protein/PAS domain S-box-containing protein
MTDGFLPEHFVKILQAVGEGVYILDGDRRVQFWNHEAEHITGYTASEVVGRKCSDNILVHVDEHGKKLCMGCCPVEATLRDAKSRQITVYLHHKMGHRVAVEARTMLLPMEAGKKLAVELFHEAGSQRAMQEEIAHLRTLSLVDPLTGLPNRRQLEAVLDARLAAMRRNDIAFGVMFIDIDDFKLCNDLHGHQAGDQVLAAVARTLLSSVRPFDTVGRWGGEEFLGIFPRISLPTLVEIAARLKNLVAATSAEHQGTEIGVTVSMGITLARPGDTAETLVSRADALMYRSKEDGRNRVTSG